MFWKILIEKCECPPCAEHLCRVQGSVPWNTPSFRERTSLWGRWTGCREGRHCGPAAEESPCDSEWGPTAKWLWTLVPRCRHCPLSWLRQPGRLGMLGVWPCQGGLGGGAKWTATPGGGQVPEHPYRDPKVCRGGVLGRQEKRIERRAYLPPDQGFKLFQV